MIDTDKIFFNPGELCTLKHEELNAPIMIVTEKVTKVYKKDNEINNSFVGIKCRWFSTDLKLQEAVFSTKDLIHV